MAVGGGNPRSRSARTSRKARETAPPYRRLRIGDVALHDRRGRDRCAMADDEVDLAIFLIGAETAVIAMQILREQLDDGRLECRRRLLRQIGPDIASGPRNSPSRLAPSVPGNRPPPRRSGDDAGRRAAPHAWPRASPVRSAIFRIGLGIKDHAPAAGFRSRMSCIPSPVPSSATRCRSAIRPSDQSVIGVAKIVGHPFANFGNLAFDCEGKPILP